MNAEMRSTMQTAAQVQIFNLAYPVTEPGMAPVIEDFDRRVARAEAMIGQQAESAARSMAATRARRAARKRLVDGLLWLFVKFFDLATEEQPDLRGIRVPNQRTPDPSFLLAAERIIVTAGAHLDALAVYGLTPTLVDEAAALLQEFRAAAAEARESFQARVEASKALEAVRLEIAGAIQRLDRLNRHRFAQQADVLARWETARHVINRSPRAKPRLPVEEPATGTEGGVADAA